MVAGFVWRGHPDRPPPGHTGGFGEPTCQACHFDGPLNAEGGALRLEGVPATWEPGRTYRITVTVARPEMQRAGFQLAARWADGPVAGSQAGALRPVDDRAEATEAGSPRVAYLHHTPVGTALTAPDTARWVLEWVAPEEGEGGDVAFHLTANAADDDESPFGDFIYATSLTTGRVAQ